MVNMLGLKSRPVWKQSVVLVVMIGLSTVMVLAPGMASAAEGETSQAEEAGLGIGSGILTLVYLPFKVVYAALGGIVGGFTYVLTGGDLETAKSVWEPSFYGTYVITPKNLKGEEPVRFFGVSPYDEEALNVSPHEQEAPN